MMNHLQKYFELGHKDIKDLFKVTMNEYGHLMSSLAATNIGTSAQLTLCAQKNVSHAAWITIAGHYRTFDQNVKNFLKFLGKVQVNPCRFVVLVTCTDAEAPGQAWWGNRGADNVNSQVDIVDNLRNIEKKHFQGQNFFWVALRRRKPERLADMEMVSYLLARRLKSYHDVFLHAEKA